MTADAGVTVELEHRVNAPPEQVFTYFTDPEKYRRWKGVDAELDARPGGIYRVEMAPQVWVHGEFVAVEPPDRLLITWGWESATIDLPRCLAQVPPGSSTVEFRFVPDGDGTVIHVRHSGLPSELAARGHTLGWDGYLVRLVALLEGRDVPEDPTNWLPAVYYGWDAETPARSDDSSRLK